MLLSSLASVAGPDRNEVIVPSYTCYSVAASVVRAGLRVRIVDIEARSLDFDLGKLGNADFRRVLAIVATSLYGLPANLPAIAALAKDRGVFLVDDAAQSLGAAVGQRPVGGWGDAGLCSFDKGKNVSAIDGGAVLTSSPDLHAALRAKVAALPRITPFDTMASLAKLAAYAAFLAPSRYWIPSMVPGLGLGQTAYDTRFAVRRPSRLLTVLASTMAGKLDEFQSARTSNAARYREALTGHPLISLPQARPEAVPAHLRFPLIVNDPDARDRVLLSCRQEGIGATGSYPGSIADIPELRDACVDRTDAQVGRWVSSRIVTLPTHPYVLTSDVARALACVSRALRHDGHAPAVRSDAVA
jgi:dTDP-4-amino-4,6-dideoxygalactose transaminase